jgi:hypothetical protein
MQPKKKISKTPPIVQNRRFLSNIFLILKDLGGRFLAALLSTGLFGLLRAACYPYRAPPLIQEYFLA